ncbi:MAG: acylphosphatase [Phycisphaerae bacterium]
MPSSTVRNVFFFSGRVQGIGFRQSTVELAKPYKLGGLVRNLPDGRVELILEGSPDHIDELAREIAARFAGFISSTTRQTEPVEGLAPPVRIRW